MCKKCTNCGKNTDVVNITKDSNIFCSYKCKEEWEKYNREPNCKCPVCGKSFYARPSRLRRTKNGVTCSMECSIVLRSKFMRGKGNNQYGITGSLNASFKGVEIVKKNHNLSDILVYSPNHPFKRSDNRVKKHRLVIEANYELFDNSFFINIDGKMYLKPTVDVHHINGNHNDNSIKNLIPITRSQHTTEHNKEKHIIRGKLGRIIGISKSSNIGEGCDANPEINSVIAKGTESS